MYSLSAVSLAAGSSPRVRGKPLRAAVVEGHQGLIPACAGKTTGGEYMVPYT